MTDGYSVQPRRIARFGGLREGQEKMSTLPRLFLRAAAKFLPLPGLVLLTACASAPDAHVPPFARVPYEPMSRQAVVAIALREWRLFGSPVEDMAADESDVGMPESPGTAAQEKPERQPGRWQRVGEYWWLGLDAGTPASQWTGKHDENGAVFPPDRDEEFAWSAAFVSYVMRIAGAGPRFPYSPNHAHYIDIAKRQALHEISGWVVTAERPDAYAPQPGDLVCRGRETAAALEFDNLPVGHMFPAHCDIVVDTSVPQQISVIGGNVSDAVTLRHVAVTSDGKLEAPGGQNNNRAWLAVLRLTDVPTGAE
jgi:hypothetical protein